MVSIFSSIKSAKSGGSNRAYIRAKFFDYGRAEFRRQARTVEQAKRDDALIAKENRFRAKVEARRLAKNSAKVAIAKQYGVHPNWVKLNGPANGINTPFIIKHPASR